VLSRAPVFVAAAFQCCPAVLPKEREQCSWDGRCCAEQAESPKAKVRGPGRHLGAPVDNLLKACTLLATELQMSRIQSACAAYVRVAAGEGSVIDLGRGCISVS